MIVIVVYYRAFPEFASRSTITTKIGALLQWSTSTLERNHVFFYEFRTGMYMRMRIK
jgi:hypothetical protein